MSNDCAWARDSDPDTDVWVTTCGHYFRIDEGTPADNDMKFCCYCGKPLRTVSNEERFGEEA